MFQAVFTAGHITCVSVACPAGANRSKSENRVSESGRNAVSNVASTGLDNPRKSRDMLRFSYCRIRKDTKLERARGAAAAAPRNAAVVSFAAENMTITGVHGNSVYVKKIAA
jgi:hypothetical protein